MPINEQIAELVNNTSQLLDTVNVGRQTINNAASVVNNAVSDHETSADPHSQYIDNQELNQALTNHTSQANPHTQYVQKIEGQNPVFSVSDEEFNDTRLVNDIGEFLSINEGISIISWLSNYDGTVNQRNQLLQALQDTSSQGKTLIIDLPVRIDATNGNEIFIPNNTSIKFVGSGEIIGLWSTNPLFHILHNSVKIHDLKLRYAGPGLDAAVSINTSPGNTQGNAFFQRIKSRMQTLFGNTFSGLGDPAWYGPSAFTSGFYLEGGCNVEFTGNSRIYVAENTPANQFIPMVIVGKGQWIPGINISSNTGNSDMSENIARPTFKAESLYFDGTLMGIQGEFLSIDINKTRSRRYSDLMSSDGTNIGGVGNYFPPPHLFYINDRTTHVNITDTVDYGIWTTTNSDRRARRTSSSGWCNSLKVNSVIGNVTGYESYRPDGLADLLGDTAGYGKCEYTFSNFYAEYDSTLLDQAFSCIRFPSPPYIGTRVLNGKLVDTAGQTTREVLGSNGDNRNREVVIDNVEVIMRDFTGANWPGTFIAGSRNKINVRYVLKDHTQTQTFRGIIGYQGTAAANTTNTIHKAEVVGWRGFYNDVNGLRNRLFMNGGTSGFTGQGNYAELIDISNNHTIVQNNGFRKDRWVQKVVVNNPAGASVSPVIKIPANWTVVERYIKTKVALGTTSGTTGYRVGWSGALDGLGVVNVVTNSGQVINNNVIASTVADRQLIVTADGGNFDGTGLIEIVIVCENIMIGE